MCFMNKEEQSRRGEDVIAGRNAVTEALRSGRPIDSLYVARGAHTGSIGALIAKAKKQGIPVKEAECQKAGLFVRGTPYIRAWWRWPPAHTYASLDDLFALAQERGEPPFFIVADELEDPHNLGAILRTAECAGAHGVIIPKRRSVGLTYAVGKASAGAVEYVPVGPRDQYRLHFGGTQAARGLDLRRGYGRAGLVLGGLQRADRFGDRFGGIRRQLLGQRKL